MNRPLPRTFQIVWRTTKWRVDWQRSSRSGRSIVAGLGVDTGDHPHSAIENSQIDSQYMKDNLEWHYILCRPQVVALDVVVFWEVDGNSIYYILNLERRKTKRYDIKRRSIGQKYT